MYLLPCYNNITDKNNKIISKPSAKKRRKTAMKGKKLTSKTNGEDQNKKVNKLIPTTVIKPPGKWQTMIFFSTIEYCVVCLLKAKHEHVVII